MANSSLLGIFNLVFRYLMSAVFEPLVNKSLRIITLKTLFLVALATAKGWEIFRPCLQLYLYRVLILSFPICYHLLLKQIQLTTLYLDLLFLNNDLAGNLNEGSLLCPVRTLFIYLNKLRYFW